MTSASRAGRLPLVPLAVLGLVTAAVVAGQLGRLAFTATPVDEPPAVDGADGPSDAAEIARQEHDRIAGDIVFWTKRLDTNPTDFVAATKLALAHLDSARATGDVTAYLRAEAAADAALRAQPDHLPAMAARAATLVALHRFAEARELATSILAVRRNDPTALGVLGDASLELGDTAGARSAFQTLSSTADSSAARVRRSHLAFLEGDVSGAVEAAREALTAATDEGLEGPALAWYQSRLADVLVATGDSAGAAAAYETALQTDPLSYLAQSGLARVAAAEGRLDDALGHLDRAIAIVPLPELVARRADLFEVRAASGDLERAVADRATVLAIGDLAGEAANVHDRTLALYLADHGIDVARALRLAESEIRVRRDIYGYDALAWALRANGRLDEASHAMTRALALGTRDARLLYHAGMIAAELGDEALAREHLGAALDLRASLDPRSVAAARETLARLP